MKRWNGTTSGNRWPRSLPSPWLFYLCVTRLTQWPAEQPRLTNMRYPAFIEGGNPKSHQMKARAMPDCLARRVLRLKDPTADHLTLMSFSGPVFSLSASRP